jgi:hypothetical protein
MQQMVVRRAWARLASFGVLDRQRIPGMGATTVEKELMTNAASESVK